jgi:serine/threonine protein kinase
VKPGDIISERYRLLRLLDVGGMGEVWAARNELTQKSFAIKFLLPALAERPDALERFVREAEMAGSMNHRSIVDVFDVAQTEDGRAYIVMELLVGESLEARLERAGSLSSIEAAAFVAQVADGLAAAHAKGIVHRDLSLANIFLVRNPEGGRPIPKILDFGVSKTLGPNAADRTQTGHGTVLGCPEFMSPEQARGAEAVDARTDVWSLGVVLYQCLSGTPPFRAKNYNALMVGILTRPHRPLMELVPNADAELVQLVESCLEKDRDARVQTAREVSDRLGAIARRLGGASALGTAQRRATDRLPGGARLGSPDDAASGGARHLFALGVEELKVLSGLRARRSTIGIASALTGIAIGALVAMLIGGQKSEVPAFVSTPAPPALAASSAQPGRTPVGPQSAAPPRKAPTGSDPHDLAVAVARGLGLGSKSRR